MRGDAGVGRPRHPRAADGEIELYSPSTRVEYMRDAERWKKYAAARGISPTLPSVADLVEYFDSIRAAKGPRSSRRASLGVAWYFRSSGVPVLVDHPLMQQAMDGVACGSEEDPLHQIIGGTGSPRRRRSQRFADEAYHPRTHEAYRKAAMTWAAWCRANGRDPLNPVASDLTEFVAGEWAPRYAAQTIRNNLNGLSHYFRKAGVSDVSRQKKVRLVVEGICRDRPPQPSAPIFLAELRAMLSVLDKRSAFDVRDGLLLLCMGLGGLASRHLLAMDVSRFHEVDDGIIFYTNVPRMTEIFIGECGDPVLSIKLWFARWKAIVGDEPGPLFPCANNRGAFTHMPLLAQGVNQIVKAIARRAGVAPGKINATSVQKGFVIKVAQVAGPVAAAKAAGYAGARCVDSGYARSANSTRERRLRNLRRRRKWNDAKSCDTSAKEAN
jgi:hypothetical protein